MKKRLAGGLLMISVVTLLTGCHMNHEWQEATCVTPQTCSECGKTRGETAEHLWQDATCTAAKTCSVCGETEGEPLVHTWVEATCAAAKTCSVCGETEGEPLPHAWMEATYTEPKTCSVCGETEGEPRQRPYVEANNLPFSREKAFAMQGVRYDTDNRANYEFTDINVQIESITAEDGPEDDLRTIHMVIASEGDIWSDGMGNRKLSLSMPSPNLYDMYTGRKVPKAATYNNMQVETGLEAEWEGEHYTIICAERTEWKQGEWRGEYSQLGVHIYFDVTIPKDYDGLVVMIAPVEEWEIEKQDYGVVDEEEHYLMEDWKEKSLLFRIEDFL